MWQEREEDKAHYVRWRSQMVRNNFEDLDVDRKIILKWTGMKQMQVFDWVYQAENREK